MQIDSKIQSLTHKSLLHPAAKFNVLIALMSKIHFFRNMEPRRPANSGLQTRWRRKQCSVQQPTRRHVAAALNHQLHIPFAVFRETTALYCENLMKTHKVSNTATWVKRACCTTRVIRAILNKFLCRITSCLLFLYCIFIVYWHCFMIKHSCVDWIILWYINLRFTLLPWR